MIVIDGVSRLFGQVRALDNVSLTVADGERVAFVGVNGSGKTTLLRAMVGLLPVSGQVTIDGISAARGGAEALANVAYIPQIAPPIEAPAGEVVRAFCDLRGIDPTAVTALAAQFGVTLAAVARTRFRDLSGGTKQKTLAALALAARPRILVCDEPTANLDPAARAAFFAHVASRPADSTLVLCSHRTEEVLHLVDRAVELREGKVVRDVSLAALRHSLRAWRLEVDLKATDTAVHQWLTAAGFAASDPLRWGRACTHDEKLALTASLFATHAGAVADFRLVAGKELALHEAAPVGGQHGAVA